MKQQCYLFNIYLNWLVGKGIRAVPVVEVDNRQLVGHATSEQLAALIRRQPAVQTLAPKTK